jgi:hypothetical protein
MGFDWTPRFTAPFIMRIVGLLLFVCSYFFPAVTNSQSSGKPMDTALAGWSCAYFSMVFLVGSINNLIHGRVHGQGIGILIGVSGLISLLVPAFLAVRNYAWKSGLAIVTTVLVIIVVPATLHFLEMKAVAGCYLWLGGTLLVLLSEFLPLRRRDMPSE